MMMRMWVQLVTKLKPMTIKKMGKRKKQLGNEYRTSTEQATEISPSVVALLKAIGNQELKITEMMEGVGLKHRPTFLYYYLTPAIEA